MNEARSLSPPHRLTLRACSLVLVALPGFAALLASTRASAGDWPQYRFDAARSAASDEPFVVPERALWTWRSPRPPRPAWPRSRRMQFDRALRPVVLGDTVYFGSSADDRVIALDAQSGRERWTFLTGAPVRLAPVASSGGVFVASDDGRLYALSPDDGDVLWTRRLGENDDFVLGNGRLVSRWPVRGGPVLHDGKLYVAAGIWPSEGVVVACLDPTTGEETWARRDLGSLHMGQPHGGAFADSGVAAQGHLAADGTHLYVPTGRAVPAALGLADGELSYFHLQKYGHFGGAEITVTGAGFCNGGRVYAGATGLDTSAFRGGRVVARGETLWRLVPGKLETFQWVEKTVRDRRGEPLSQTLPDRRDACQAPWDVLPQVAIAAGDTIVAACEDGTVHAFDARRGESVWKFALDAPILDLVYAGGRLLASSSEGTIRAFGSGTDSAPQATSERRPEGDLQRQEGELARRHREAARRVLSESGVEAGYCVDVAAGDGSLALALARQSDLVIYCLEDDPELAELARTKFFRAGLYGTRIVLHERHASASGYPAGFADLVVSGRSVTEGVDGVPLAAARRLLRPYGGIACFGATASEKIVQPAPGGAGSWTHQYGDAANTSCSGDDLVRGPFEVLWYRDIPQEIPQRHGRGPAPLFENGRLFSEGLDSLICVNAYNGRKLWEVELPGILRAYDGDHLMGVSGTGSNFCLNDESVYVRRGRRCLRLAARSGEKLGVFTVPQDEGEAKGENADGEVPAAWGYLASVGDRLFGTVVDPSHTVTYRYQPGGDMKQQFTESRRLFALDRRTGEVLWQYTARHSIRHNAIAVGEDAVYLIDRAQAAFDRRRGAKAEEHPEGVLVALDIATGKRLWDVDEGVYGTLLILDAANDGLLMGYQHTRFRLASELGGRLSVFHPASGSLRWERDGLRYTTRPVVVGDTIYAEGGAWSVASGEERTFRFARSYGCGQLAASRHTLLYRSATLGYFDLDDNKKNVDFGGLRPGCWINALPVGGLVLVPDASAGCKCSYLNQAWIALRPRAADGVSRPRRAPRAPR